MSNKKISTLSRRTSRERIRPRRQKRTRGRSVKLRDILGASAALLLALYLYNSNNSDNSDNKSKKIQSTYVDIINSGDWYTSDMVDKLIEANLMTANDSQNIYRVPTLSNNHAEMILLCQTLNDLYDKITDKNNFIILIPLNIMARKTNARKIYMALQSTKSGKRDSFGSHFIGITIKKLGDDYTIEHLDSLDGNHNDIITQIKNCISDKFVGIENAKIERRQDIYRQRDGKSCGPFTVENLMISAGIKNKEDDDSGSKTRQSHINMVKNEGW
jgi:hypothetical protein